VLFTLLRIKKGSSPVLVKVKFKYLISKMRY